MQRRLTLAIVGMALAAVILVGLGVLTLAQVGARQEAEQEVTSQLDALAAVVDNLSDSARIETSVRRLGDAFEINRLELVAVDGQGRVQVLQRPPARTEAALLLDPKQTAALWNAETVIIASQSTIIGLRQINLPNAPRFEEGGQTAALLVQQDVTVIGRQARVWFLVSAAAVLVLSAIVARWLSGRFTRPIREIEEATVRIAAGGLETRVDIGGNDELSELGQAVNRMAADLQRSRASEQEFLMSISHDLRTPLTSITGYAEALADDAAPDPKAAGDVIANNAKRLNRLVDDLLDLARLTSRQFRLELQPVDADVVVSRATAGHRLAAEEAGVGLRGEFSGPHEIVADADRLAQAVGNLIDNALKFAESTITVAVEEHDGHVVISVQDDGPGIAEEDLPFVFERLYVTKLKPRRAENSSGLGLAIVRQLAGEMGATVMAARAPGGGARMTITFSTSSTSPAN